MILFGAIALFVGLVYAVYAFLPAPPAISPSQETIIRQYQEMLDAMREPNEDAMREELRAVLNSSLSDKTS